jgi:hypothetical protein
MEAAIALRTGMVDIAVDDEPDTSTEQAADAWQRVTAVLAEELGTDPATS